ncbi:DUF2887 domain-containing protein [Nostocales cyanobacterium LEGE 11386]|nr:DUF2887 domain-containing protein [Nostocales cyanobacterium LEGE 11386]
MRLLYEFTAPEIKQKSFRLDGVFFPLEEFHQEPLYFVEIQFYKDDEFYDRLFTSIFLIDKAEEELTDTFSQRKVIEFIETIVVYKFPNLSREEIEAMLNLNLLKNTKVYQEAKAEGKEEGELKAKLKIVPKLVQRGLSIQEIAELLELDTEVIRKAL